MLGHHFTQTLESLDVVVGFLTESVDGFLQLGFVVTVVVLLTALHFVEGRTSNVDVATFHQLFLIAIEECQQQGADVRTIHIGVGHDHDAVVTQILHIKIFSFDAQTKGCYERLNFCVLVDLGVIGFLDVEDLAAQRKDRLETPIPALFGGSTSGVALHDVNLGFGRIAGAAIGQFAGQG